MTESTSILSKPIQLPSDQDASGRTLGEEEIKLLSEAIHSGTLTSTKGNFVKALETQFAEMIGVMPTHVLRVLALFTLLSVRSIPNQGMKLSLLPLLIWER
jgi:dTDP-4-amino-4,6-dideoxygalactose transaminase